MRLAVERGVLTVTVVIPAHNEAEDIQATVRSAWEQTRRPERVIVVDDGSTDDTAVLAETAGATVLQAPGGLKSRAQGIALESVTTDVVVGIDADTVLAPDAIEHLVATLEAGHDATCGAVIPQQTTGFWVRSRRFDYALARRWWRPMQQQLGRIHVLSGAVYAFRTNVLRAIGGFPLVPIGEDTNLTWSLYGAGYKIAFTPAALAYTREPESFKVFLAQIRRWAASCFQTIARHRRQLTHPARALIVGAFLWDLLSVPVMEVLFLWQLLHGELSEWTGLIGLWTLLLLAIPTAVAARDLGPKDAIRCLPAHMVAAVLNRYVYLWALIREWILGRRYAGWTGRQTSVATIAPMSRQRRLALASGGACLASLSLGGWLLQAEAPDAPMVALTQVPPEPARARPAIDITPATADPEEVTTSNSAARASSPAAADATTTRYQTDPRATVTAPKQAAAPSTASGSKPRRSQDVPTLSEAKAVSTSVTDRPEAPVIPAVEDPVVPPAAETDPSLQASTHTAADPEPTTTTSNTPAAPARDEQEGKRRSKKEKRDDESRRVDSILDETARRHREQRRAAVVNEEDGATVPERSQR